VPLVVAALWRHPVSHLLHLLLLCLQGAPWYCRLGGHLLPPASQPALHQQLTLRTLRFWRKLQRAAATI